MKTSEIFQESGTGIVKVVWVNQEELWKKWETRYSFNYWTVLKKIDHRVASSLQEPNSAGAVCKASGLTAIG